MKSVLPKKPIFCILKDYGIAVLSVMMAMLLCYSTGKLIRKGIEEEAMEGFVSQNAVSFFLSVSEEVSFWDGDFRSVNSISYMPREMTDLEKPEHAKYISFRSNLILPPHTGSFSGGAEAWNEADHAVFAGKSLDVRFYDSEPFYVLDQVIPCQVQGRLGLKHTVTQLDTMLYISWDGKITPQMAGQRLVADGQNAGRIREELIRFAEKAGGELTVTEQGGNSSVFAGQNVLLIVTAAVAVGFLYLGYLWFEAMEKEIWVLHLFGEAKTEVVWQRIKAPALCMGGGFLAYLLTELIIEPYVVFRYAGYWMLCLLAMTLLLGGLCFIGVKRIRSIKDSSQKLKKY